MRGCQVPVERAENLSQWRGRLDVRCRRESVRTLRLGTEGVSYCYKKKTNLHNLRTTQGET